MTAGRRFAIHRQARTTHLYELSVSFHQVPCERQLLHRN
jgi:hypothetical protein